MVVWRFFQCWLSNFRTGVFPSAFYVELFVSIPDQFVFVQLTLVNLLFDFAEAGGSDVQKYDPFWIHFN